MDNSPNSQSFRDVLVSMKQLMDARIPPTPADWVPSTSFMTNVLYVFFRQGHENLRCYRAPWLDQANRAVYVNDMLAVAPSLYDQLVAGGPEALDALYKLEILVIALPASADNETDVTRDLAKHGFIKMYDSTNPAKCLE